MADFTIEDYSTNGPDASGPQVSVQGAGYPTGGIHFPKVVTTYRGELVTHLFWGYAGAFVSCSLFSGSTNATNFFNATGAFVDPVSPLPFSVDCWGRAFTASIAVGEDASCAFRYQGQSNNIQMGNYLNVYQMPVLLPRGCVPNYPAGSTTNRSLNWNLPQVNYFCGFNITAGGGFNGNWTRGVNDWQEAIYISDAPTLGVNDFPVKCFDPPIAPLGITDDEFFTSFITSRSSGDPSEIVSCQLDLSEKMLIVKQRSQVGNLRTFGVYLVSFEPFNFNRRNCDPEQVTFEWRLLDSFDVELTDINNDVVNRRFSVIAFANGWILGVALNGTAALGVSQQGAFIDDTGRVSKFTYEVEASALFLNDSTFIGIFIGPDGKLMYGLNFQNYIRLGQSIEPFINPLPPPSRVLIGPAAPINGFELTEAK